MTTSSFNLRGLPPEVMTTLKKKARELKISVNSLILRLIEQGTGFADKPKRSIHHDLDFFFDTWSEKESKEFEKNVEIFEKIDTELWK